MSVEIKFKGEYVFENIDLLNDAISEVNDFLEGEDASVIEEWKESNNIEANKIIIDLHVGCTEDDFLNFEGIIETLADKAVKGKVVGWRDDYEEGDEEEYDAEEIDYSEDV